MKIDGTPWDNATNNEPHPGCILQIDFYGYDFGPTLRADWELVLHSPTRATTGSGIIGSGDISIGEDQAGGGTDHDASVTVTCILGGRDHCHPPPKQGYHVKLTVHADGSIGADTKHKTFWVTCTAQVLPTTVTSPPTTGPRPTSAPTSPAVPTTVLPSTISPPSGLLAFTGSDPGRRIAIALALLLFGTAALRASRLRGHYHRG